MNLLLPDNFDDWKICIVKKCGIQLSRDFARRRLDIYTDSLHPETQAFISLYGVQHLNNIISWLNRIAQ